MRRRRLGVALIGLLGVILLCAGGLFFWLHSFDPPGDWHNPPLYPGAEQVSRQDFGTYGLLQLDGSRIMQVITFSVAAKPEAIKRFYESEYDARWTPGHGDAQVWVANRVSFTWSSPAVRSISIYFIDITTHLKPSSKTEVNLQVSMFPGE